MKWDVSLNMQENLLLFIYKGKAVFKPSGFHPQKMAAEIKTQTNKYHVKSSMYCSGVTNLKEFI